MFLNYKLRLISELMGYHLLCYNYYNELCRPLYIIFNSFLSSGNIYIYIYIYIYIGIQYYILYSRDVHGSGQFQVGLWFYEI